MSTKRDRKHLETYFETGDRPTEEEFSELINSGINQLDDQIHVVNTETDPNKLPDLKVGIGTDRPEAKLHVNGGVEIEGNTQIKGDLNGKDSNWSIFNIHASKQGATGGSYMHMYGSQHHVTDNQGNQVDHNNQGGITFVASGNGKANGFKFVHFNVDKHNNIPNDGNPDKWHGSLRINGHGNVGIGLGGNEPNEKLQVNGNVRTNDHDIYLRGGTDTNHGIGFYGGGKGVFMNGTDPINVDGPVVYGYSGGALGINQNGNQYVNLLWDHNRRVGINGLGGIQHHPYNFQVWGNGNHAPVQIESSHNDAIIFHDADGSNTNPFTFADKTGKRGFQFYSHTPGDWQAIAEFTKDGSKIRKELEISSVNDNSKTGLKLPSGAADGRILVSNGNGEASWQDGTVVTSGLWQKIGSTDHIRNGNNPNNIGIGTSGTHIPREKLEVNGGILAHKLAGNSSLFIVATSDPSEHGASIELHNSMNSNSGGIDFTSNGDLDNTSFRFITKNSDGSSDQVPMKIDGHGRVGIGTLDPKERLQLGDRLVYHDGGSKILGYNFKYENGKNRRQVNDGVGLIYLNDGNFNFVTAPSDVPNSEITGAKTGLMITNSGKVGVGTNNPSRTLDVDGDSNFRGDVLVHGYKPFIIKRYPFKKQTYKRTITDYSPNDYEAVIGGFLFGKMSSHALISGVVYVDEYCIARIYESDGNFELEARFPDGTLNSHNGGKGKEKVIEVLFIRKELAHRASDAPKL